MKRSSIIIIGLGIVLFLAAFYKPVLSFVGHKQDVIEQGVTGMIESTPIPDQKELMYNVKIKNSFSTPVRLCGGQMAWCGRSACYQITTSLPLTLEPQQETTIAVSILGPSENELAETELLLYADGKSLKGLTPVKIKLPAMSLNPP